MPTKTAFEIIAPTTAAVATEVRFDVTRELAPIIITTSGANASLAGVEEIDIYFSTDGGTNWETYYDSDPATPIKFIVTVQKLVFNEPIILGFLKDSTAGLVGLWAFKGL